MQRDVVNYLRRGATGENGGSLGDDHATMSPSKWARRQGGHSAPNSSTVKNFSLPSVIHLSDARIVAAGVNPGAGSPAVRCTASTDLFQYCTMVIIIRASDRAS
jgi:hypothetical protein